MVLILNSPKCRMKSVVRRSSQENVVAVSFDSLVFQQSGTKFTPFPVLYQCLGITEAQLDPLIEIEHDILDRFPVQFRRGVDPHSRPSS